MSTPKFSIVIPVYNAAETIVQLISILKKFNNEEFEVLLINDGSTDNTEQVIRDCIFEDFRFRLLNKVNEGPGFARNYGIERANGDFLLFFDADDFPDINILNDYSAIISKNPFVDLIISSFIFRTIDRDKIVDEKNYLVDGYTYQSNSEFLLDMYKLMNRQLLYVVWNKCYRRDVILRYGIRFEKYHSCEDRIFNLDYYKYCNQVVMNPKIEYIYEFESSQGITNKYKKDKFDTFKEFYERSNAITNNEHKDGMAALLLKGTTSVIFSIFETNEITIQQKKNEIKNILKDDLVKEAKNIAITDTLTKKITKLLFNLPIPLVTFVFYLGSFIETKMPKVMANIKRKY